MNRFLKFPLYMAASAMIAASMTACDDDNSNGMTGADTKEQALKEALVPYVDNTVIPTYKQMADEAIVLSDLCDQIRDTWKEDDNNAKTKATELNRQACEHWKASRKAWELSEAFLFGAAADYNIDPHIDSWPLDKVALENTLKNSAIMENIVKDGIASVTGQLGYGLLGYHALEYMLFQLTGTGAGDSEPRDFTKDYSAYAQYQNVNVTKNHLIYMAAVAEDLRNQCVRLEASWAGIDKVSQDKQTILTENELEPTFNYGESMKNAGQGGSKYKSNTLAAQELIQGCIDIVDEVGKQKIGRPNAPGTSEEGAEADKNYIESPYALNSIEDFQDNIISVRNAYEGQNGDKSVSDYIAGADAAADKSVKDLIEESINKIKAIPEPFATHATGPEADAAIASLDKLLTALEKANDVLINK